MDVGVTINYWVYPDPTHYGLTVDIASEISGDSRRVHSRERVEQVIRTHAPSAEWTDRPADWLNRVN